jgi:hypothetical protein
VRRWPTTATTPVVTLRLAKVRGRVCNLLL